MLHPLRLNLPVTIRPVQSADMLHLEWFGLMTPFREVLQHDFARFQQGENIYLVAEVNDFPVGQVVADMVRFQKKDTGYIMALRVMPPFQRLGIARQLLAAIEAAIWQNGYAMAQLNVAKGNASAKRLYKKSGYRIMGELHEPWHYTTPTGIKKTVNEVEWVMQKLLTQPRFE